MISFESETSQIYGHIYFALEAQITSGSRIISSYFKEGAMFVFRICQRVI